MPTKKHSRRSSDQGLFLWTSGQLSRLKVFYHSALSNTKLLLAKSLMTND